MFEILIVSQANDRCDNCNHKYNNHYESDSQIELHCFDDRKMEFYCYIKVRIGGE